MSSEQRSNTIRTKGALQVSSDSQIQLDAAGDPDGVTIIVTQAFCPKGHNLISEDNPKFSGHPGIKLVISDGEHEGEVVLSPVHGDATKRSPLGDWTPAPGTRMVSVRCPVCGTELDILGDCVTGDGGKLRAIYLTSRLSEGYAALVCDVWDCHYSKVVDDWDLLSEVVIQETEGKV